MRGQSVEAGQLLHGIGTALVDEVGWQCGPRTSGQKVDRAQGITGEDDATLFQVECAGARRVPWYADHARLPRYADDFSVRERREGCNRDSPRHSLAHAVCHKAIDEGP